MLGVLTTGHEDAAAAAPEHGPSVRFRVLGPLDVHNGCTVCTPRPHKLRVLLALFLTRCNQVISIESLIDELWSDAPPRTVRKALRVYVWQLRQTIARLPVPGGRPALVTREPGYCFQVDRELLDLHQFERLCARGHARKQSQPELAVMDYTEALALWRGGALCDVLSAPLLRGVAQRLEESRLAAVEHHIDLKIRLRRNAEAIAELRELTADYPLHEGAHARLMRALYLTGRKSDALAAHSKLRKSLVEELGVEPSMQLRQLHGAMLAGDDSAVMRWESWVT
jgi:DNA-binding SARP family transcriptional activator